jgi:ferrous iron transport protein A
MARNLWIKSLMLYATPPVVARSPLGRGKRGFRGRIDKIHAHGNESGLPPEELERRLIELGFVEGASVEILHEGIFGRDPIAVRVDSATVALRRREAMAILVV